MPGRSRAIALIEALLCLPFSAANPFSSGTATAAVSTNAWVIPLTGPTATGAPWGANVSQSTGKSPVKVPIALGGSDQTNSSNTAIAVDAIAPFGISNAQLLIPGASELLLANKTALSVQVAGSTSPNATLPTVPFSLTLGYGSSWNGSVIFGGYFDKNRVFAEKWTPTEQTLAGNTTLLSTGQQSVGLVSFRKYTFEGVVPSWEDTQTTPATPFGHSSPGEVDPNHHAILDFNSDTLALPSKEYCGANITITLNPGYADRTYSELQIAIPAELTSSDKCVSASDTVVLGKPFFQAAMVYVDDGGNIYFNAANRWALPVVLDAFNKDAMLNVPSQPATATQSATPTPTKSSSAALNELPSPIWMMLMTVAAFSFAV